MRRMTAAALAVAGAALALPAAPASALPCTAGFQQAPYGSTSQCFVGDLTGFAGVVSGSVRIELLCGSHVGGGSSAGPVALGGPFSGLHGCTFRITATSSGTTARFLVF